MDSLEDLKRIPSYDRFADYDPKIRFYNLKEILVEREAIIKQLSKEKRDIPCTDEFKVRSSPYLRVIFYPSGKTFTHPVLDVTAPHNKRALFDISYDTRLVPFRFSAEELIASRDINFRKCQLCVNCSSNWEGNTWCNVPLNGSVWKGTFDPGRAKRCRCFVLRSSVPDTSVEETALNQKEEVDYSTFKEGRDYYLWVNKQ